ncbi:MAG: outer membrane beta-barrel protein [Chryseolinea sp.]
MKLKNVLILFFIALMGCSTASFGQDSTAAFTFGGSVDTYFHSSFGTRNNNAGGAYSPSTSFANNRGFALGMVNLIASYGGEKVGFVADVVFGPRGKDAVFGTATGQGIINQAFVYYKIGDVVTLNLGQFNTFLGYEVISPTVNFHYSTSYLFSWGPFNHTGLRADFDFGGGWVGKLAVMNPTDIVEFNPVNTYTGGLQIGKTGDAGGVWLNFLYGDQDGKLDAEEDEPFAQSDGTLFQADITAGYNLSEAFYLGFNASYQMVGEGEVVNGNNVDDLGNDSRSFYGIALYPKLTLSENFALGVRAEYFAVTESHLDGIISADGEGDGNVMEFTLSGNYKVGGFTFIPEVRVDIASEDTFYKNDDFVDGNFDGIATETLMPSVNLAAVYKF